MTIIICNECNSYVMSPKENGVAFCKCKHCAVHRIGDTVTVDAPGTDFFTVVEKMPEPVTPKIIEPKIVKKGK